MCFIYCFLFLEYAPNHGTPPAYESEVRTVCQKERNIWNKGSVREPSLEGENSKIKYLNELFLWFIRYLVWLYYLGLMFIILIYIFFVFYFFTIFTFSIPFSDEWSLKSHPQWTASPPGGAKNTLDYIYTDYHILSK